MNAFTVYWRNRLHDFLSTMDTEIICSRLKTIEEADAMSRSVVARLLAFNLDWTPQNFFKRVCLEWFIEHGVKIEQVEDNEHFDPAVPDNWEHRTLFRLQIRNDIVLQLNYTYETVPMRLNNQTVNTPSVFINLSYYIATTQRTVVKSLSYPVHTLPSLEVPQDINEDEAPDLDEMLSEISLRYVRYLSDFSLKFNESILVQLIEGGVVRSR